jgi:putative transposase
MNRLAVASFVAQQRADHARCASSFGASAGIAMAYKLIDAAQARWRKVNAPELVARVRAGAVFYKGKLLERPTDITPASEPSQTPETEVA